MTNLTDEQILEFCHATEGWFWDDDPVMALHGTPKRLNLNSYAPFVIKGGCPGTKTGFKHFSLSQPQVYEDKKWYSAKVLKVLNGYIKICCHYNSQLNRFICDGIRYSENDLTDIRPIPPELWEGEG